MDSIKSFLVDIEFEKYLPFATSLLGAFFGALGAYYVGRFKERRDEEKRQHTALLATQYALFSQWHVVESVRRFLEPQRSHKHRATRLGKYANCDAERVPFSDLTFIIDSKEPNLLQEIHLAQMSYTHVVMAVESYNEAKTQFQAEHPPVNLNMETKISKIELTKDEYNRMALVVDWLYQQTDEALPKFDLQIQNIHKFIKSHFKGKNKAIQLVSVEKLQ